MIAMLIPLNPVLDAVFTATKVYPVCVTAAVMSKRHFSVSYTHLDVYKRQMYYNPEYTNNLDGIKAYLIRVVSVSYTHLAGDGFAGISV